MTTTTKPEKSKEDQLKEIGHNAAQSIIEMVAALNCDYDRLEELKDRLADTDEENRPVDPLTPDEMEEFEQLKKDAGDCEDREDAEQRIQEDALSLEFRSGWTSDKEDMQPEEFCLLLATGGPAVRIIGDVDHHGELTRPRLQVQDWFTPWTEVFNEIEQDTLEAYVSCYSCQ